MLTRPYGHAAEDPVRLVGRVAGVLSIGAGVIHVSAAGDHTNLPIMFVGFLVVATLQVGLGAVLLWRRPSRIALGAAIALMLGAIATWLLSRTAGLPFLEDGHTEPIGFKDGVTVLFEVASIPPLLLLLSRDLDHVTMPSPRLASQTLTALGAGVVALMTPALLLAGGGHHSHEQAAALGIHGHAEGEAAHAEPEQAHSEDPENHHRADRSRPGSEERAHGHGETAPAARAHEHHAVQLASVPTGGHEHAGSGAPVSHSEQDHAGREDGGRHRREHPQRQDRHENRPRGGDDRTKPEGGDEHHEGGDDHADDPQQPLDDVVGDVVALVPLPSAESRRRCARRQSRSGRARVTKRCLRRRGPRAG